jgi:hypothetical protein
VDDAEYLRSAHTPGCVQHPGCVCLSLYSSPPYKRWGSVAELTCHSQGSTLIGLDSLTKPTVRRRRKLSLIGTSLHDGTAYRGVYCKSNRTSSHVILIIIVLMILSIIIIIKVKKLIILFLLLVAHRFSPTSGRRGVSLLCSSVSQSPSFQFLAIVHLIYSSAPPAQSNPVIPHCRLLFSEIWSKKSSDRIGDYHHLKNTTLGHNKAFQARFSKIHEVAKIACAVRVHGENDAEEGTKVATQSMKRTR